MTEINFRESQKRRLLELNDIIENFEGIINDLPPKIVVEHSFHMTTADSYVCFYKIIRTDEGMPIIATSVTIQDDLYVSVFFKDCKINDKDEYFKNILENNRICKWSMLNKLIEYVNSLNDTDYYQKNVQILLKKVYGDIKLMTDSTNNSVSDDIKLKLRFLKAQFKLAFSKSPRYETDTFLWASTFYFSHPAAYSTLRNYAVLTLPHPKNIQKLSLKLDIGSTSVQKSQITYLKEKLKFLEPKEKLVNLLLDEIYIKSSLDYKNGKIDGTCCNDETSVASTIQTFMISSIFSKNKDVVGLYPVNHLKAELLLKLLKIVIKILTDTGYQIVTVISDNNSVNRNCFEQLCGGSIKSSIPNPFNSNWKIFILFDTVHILKCIRNNWLNQKDTNQSFIIPLHFNNPNDFVHASISHLKEIYYNEEDSIAKMAPALNPKVLFPSSLERQNVNLCLKLFDEKNISALKLHKNCKAMEGTAAFLSFASNWWKCVNNKSAFLGIMKRDTFRDPIRTMEDKNIVFLRSFVDWLDMWENNESPKRVGKLTKLTYFSLRHTTITIVHLCEYLLNTLKFEYVCLGKFQTDKLEKRFGQYRQMSGGNYHISVKQVLESEKRLKVISLLKLKSFSHGEFQLQEFLSACEDDKIDGVLDLSKYEGIYDMLVNINEQEISSLIYICGYIAKKVCREKVSCDYCKNALVIPNKDLVLEKCVTENYIYLDTLNRGGLKYPTEFLVNVVIHTYKLFNAIITERFERHFLAENNQRALFIKLSLVSLQNSNIIGEDCCQNCEKYPIELVQMLLQYFTNILLNNYTKNRNYKLGSTSKEKKIMKLQSK